MAIAIIAIVIGLVIVVLAVGTPYFLTHRRMRNQHDSAEAQAYAEATGRSREQIGASHPGQPLDGGDAADRWRSVQAGVDPETGETARAGGNDLPGDPR